MKPETLETLWRIASMLVAAALPTGIGVYIIKKLVTGLGNRVTTAIDAYSGERAKLLAQFHNLDKLVEQTEKLTITTEGIKARISDEMWDRQMRWTYKRDLYVRVVEALTEVITAEAEYQGQTDPYSSEDAMNKSKEVGTKMKKLFSLIEIAPLALSEFAVRTLSNLKVHAVKELYTREHLESLKAHLSIFRTEAKKDLGFSNNVDESAS